jgi:hypothetical protein
MQLHSEVFNERDYIWVGFDTKYQDYLVQGFRKVNGGVKHFVGRYKQARLETIYHDLDRAYFSKRPFQLGQGCDGSGDECCFALFHHFCLSQGLGSVELHQKAYGKRDRDKYQAPNPEKILELANWQGVAYPTEWTKAAYEGLIESLYGINNRSLVAVIEDIVENSLLFLEKQIREQTRQLNLLD